MSEPPAFSNLVEMLEWRAAERPGRVAFHFDGRDHTFAAIAAASRRVAAALAGRGVGRGDRVVVALPNGPEFFAAFYGAQRLGAVPVPVFPRSGAGRVRDIAALCGAAAVVAPESAAAAAVADLDGAAAAGGEEAGDGPPAAPVPSDHPALIQYTSGSTGDPKGVVLSHAALLTNARQMIAGMEITAADVFVSWLPVQHDMGLILKTIVPFVVGARLVLLPSDLTDVRRWLAAVAEHRGTFTAAPDFAYRLCLRAVRDPAAYDLRSLRVALNAAEPVRASTVRRFHRAFGLERVMVAGYGLAEAAVGVSMQKPGTDIVVAERGFVAVGRPFPEVEVEVVAGDDGPAPAGEIGELAVASPAITSGYFGNPAATEALFWRPGWVRTGDLGYRDAAGHLFVVGRIKNVIIQAGRNLAPQEIEEAVEALPFVRRAAAVGIDRGREEGEQAYVFAELRRARPPAADRLREMARQVVERFDDRLGVRPGRVILLRPRAIPLTPNGKVRHAALRQAFLDGGLAAAGAVVFS